MCLLFRFNEFAMNVFCSYIKNVDYHYILYVTFIFHTLIHRNSITNGTEVITVGKVTHKCLEKYVYHTHSITNVFKLFIFWNKFYVLHVTCYFMRVSEKCNVCQDHRGCISFFTTD